MRSATRHQLARLDQALLALANERARLFASLGADERPRASASDLLRRNPGPLAAEHVRALFAALDAGCADAALGPSPYRRAGDGEGSAR